MAHPVTLALASGVNGCPMPVSATNPVPVTGSFSASTSARATAAAPSYSEGTDQPISQTLDGALRISGTINATSAATATAAAPSYIEGAASAFSQNLTGDLRTISKLAAGTAIVGKFGIDQTTPGTTNAVAVTNAPTAWSVNSGNKDNGTLRVTIVTDQVQLTNALKVDGSAVTQPVSIATAPALVAGTALAGDVGLQLRATNGLLTSYTSCANSNNATSVKGSAGSIAHIRAFNNSAVIAYLKLYNKASAPNPASDTVVDKILIPANTSGAGVVLDIAYGQKFTTGIAFAVVTGFGDTDNTSIAANAYSVTILYQ